MTQPIIQFNNVTKSYGDHTVLRELNFRVAPGEKLALIGPSGSGKTTILRVLMTLEGIDTGDVVVDGDYLLHEEVNGKLVPASEAHLSRMRGKTGMVFQQFNLFPHMTVLRNVTLPQMLSQKRDKRDAEALAVELLGKVGLADKLHHYPAQLSGGQKQRVAIARAMALKPRIMLFDEVTSALDPELVAEVLTVLHMLAEETDMTMLLVTHEMEFARSFADRVMFFDSGRIVEEGPPDKIFSAPSEPRTRSFLGKLNATGLVG